jgi:hypothetical protein
MLSQVLNGLIKEVFVLIAQEMWNARAFRTHQFVSQAIQGKKEVQSGKRLHNKFWAAKLTSSIHQ